MSRNARGLGVQVVARVPSDGPVPPPMSVVMPAATAWSTIRGQTKCTWQSIPPAVRMRPSPAMMSVDGPISRSGSHAIGDVGVAGLAERDDAALADAHVAADDAPVVEDDDVRDDDVGRALRRRPEALEHRFADGLAAAEDGLVATDAAVLFDLEPEVGVGEPQAVAHGGAVERGVAGAVDAGHRATCRPGTVCAPASFTSVTVRDAPGSNRSDVPAGMSKRKPVGRGAVERSASLTRRRGSASRPGSGDRRC